MLIRTLDILFSVIGFIVLLPLFFILIVACYCDTKYPIFWQTRVGKNRSYFTILKFRTMKIATSNLPTHLIDEQSVTLLGGFLRKYKLDELPQLWNVLIGDMSIVGPRPCLINQTELIEERCKHNIFSFKPGITGLAQIEDVDMKDPVYLTAVDKQMMSNLSFKNYMKYIWVTFKKVLKINSST